jgi:hypothetical protein
MKAVIIDARARWQHVQKKYINTPRKSLYDGLRVSLQSLK